MITADGLPRRERTWAFVTIALALTMAVLDGSIVNVALPNIAKDLHVDPASVIWVINAYQLAIVAALLPLAFLGESIGYKRVYWVGLAVFTLGSLGCALSGSLALLVAARILQGFGAAGIMSVNSALVRFIYPQAMLGRGLGNNALVVALSSAAGPTIAATILSLGSWPWLFLVNVPIGAVALVIAARALPDTPKSGRRFDWLSAGLNAITFGLLITGIDGISNAPSLAIPALELAGAAAIGAAFVWYQLNLPAPLLPVDLMRIPVFALSMVASVSTFAAASIAFVALPFYLQDVTGRSEVATGLLMTPWPAAVAVIAPIAGRLTDRFSPGALGGLGLAALCAGLVLLALVPADAGTPDLVWRLAVCGFGFGLFQSPNNKMIITSAPPERSGGASGMLSTARLTGQSLGAALVAVTFGIAGPRDTGLALIVAATLAGVGCCASTLRTRSGP
jgi:DHA2 family multidrug resistance protein-like MFS transporter